MTDTGLLVIDVDPFLQKLSLVDCHSLRKVNILKQWKEQHKTVFWSCFEKVKENKHHCVLFLHLTKASYSYIVSATDEELVNAMKNLGCTEEAESRDERIRALMLFILAKMAPYPSDKACVSQPKMIYS